ncbi:glycosyl transferase 2 family protein [Lysobacter antibioticus]|uniref:glycosyltransferase family 2 protein n=1 Tax=Lysobacter antibioticus TaxID=84531 RepID=UPI00071733B0|nr:glycosyltransferase family 2 protein [Lysobacter antibioticus]ALN62941.1 glycosyl transferase 2 family protein [Lysobacter antibioticus]
MLSVISPVYGCEGCLEELVDRIRASISQCKMQAEIILVNDGSPDRSWERIVELAARYPEVRGLRLSRNFGQHYAIAAGLEHARGELIAVIDCDLQDRPEELPRLVEMIRHGYDAVFGQRTERQDSMLKRFTSYTFFRTLSYLTDVPQDHSTANFGVFSRKVIDTVNLMPEADRCFPLMVKWTGFRSTAVPVEHAERLQGQSSYSLGKLIRLATNIVLTYSDKPLRLVVRVGLVFSLIAFAIVLLAIYRYSLGDVAVAGFTSVIASIWLLGGATIFCLGVTGLYLGRLFNDTKGRPYYIVSDQLNTPEETP